MIPKLGVDMTTGEAKCCVADLVNRLGLRWVVSAATNASREEASRKTAEADEEFQLAANVAHAAGIETEGDADEDSHC